MASSQTRTLIVLTVAMATVGGLLYTTEPADPLADPQATVALIPASNTAWTEIRVSGVDEPFALKFRAGEWSLSAPEQADADGKAVNELLDELESVAMAVPVPAPDSLSEYGLTEPIRVTLVEGNTEQYFELGRAAPAGWRTYGRTASGQVVAVNGHPRDLLTHGPLPYRDRRIFKSDPAQVTSVKLQVPEGTLRVFEAGEDWWVENYNRADLDRVDELILGLLDLRMIRFAEPDEAPFTPSRTVLLTSEEDTETVVFGEPWGELTPVRSGELLGVIPSVQTALLTQGPGHLMDRDAFPLEPYRDDVVRLDIDEKSYVISRVEQKWIMGETDLTEAVNQLATVPQLRDSDVPEGTMERTVGDSWLVLTISRGGRTRSLELFRSHGLIVAQDKAGGAPYVVGSEVESLVGQVTTTNGATATER